MILCAILSATATATTTTTNIKKTSINNIKKEKTAATTIKTTLIPTSESESEREFKSDYNLNYNLNVHRIRSLNDQASSGSFNYTNPAYNYTPGKCHKNNKIK